MARPWVKLGGALGRREQREAATRLLAPANLEAGSGAGFGLRQLLLACGLGVSVVGALASLPQGSAAEPVPLESTSGPEAVTAERAETLIQQLGGATFAERERAMGEILQLGGAMAPHLQAAIQQQTDPELVLRAKMTLSQVAEDDLETAIQAFLAGGPETNRHDRQRFAGWAAVEQIMGDTPAVRELFVTVMKAHPDVTASLDSTTAQRTAAAERVAASVQIGMLERRQPPTLADAVAMLLPLTDPQVRIGAGYEATLLSVFHRQYAAVRGDAHLWPPVSTLLTQWLLRSRLENRTNVLWNAMQWDLPASVDLALRTLQETTDTEMLQTALQVIARFGSAEDAPRLEGLLDDNRPAITQVPVMLDDQPLKVTIADVALVTLAILHKVPPSDLGMRSAQLHPKVGFLVEHAGYTDEQGEQRAAAIERARRWCQGQPPQNPGS